MLKTNTIQWMALSAVLLASCNADPKKQLEADLQEAKVEMADLKKSITEMEEELAKLDTTVEESGTPVYITTLEKGSFKHTLDVHGVVEASKNIMANPEVAGRITSISVREGQKVSKGQTLAVIDASIIRNNINEVQKNLEFATTIFEKQKTLNEKGVGTEVQFLEAKNRKESLEKTLATLNAQLAKYVVRAPISGYVDDVLPKEGEMANPQMPIARLVNLEKVFVEAEISEALLGKVEEGDNVTVNFGSIDKTVNGKIVQTGQYIDPQNRTFKIKIDLEEQNSLFKPNLLSVVEITDYQAENALSVPTVVIQDDLKGDFVYVNDNGVAKKKYVKIGSSDHEKTEILEGLEEGEVVGVKGYKGLVEGEKLEVITKMAGK